ncbi:DNA recombination protein RmuC [uncultured Cyclobacterium sp.]|uniref:DNA recombination protein RmuC n=1 Tax=uncultured Cyclobacterium sp. TaxID=453820 RepID=UPI0030EB5853|tara:strand:- start:44322 stop:45668 length:1347 start_codon:yes stop_codon:yes gene_type:complete
MAIELVALLLLMVGIIAALAIFLYQSQQKRDLLNKNLNALTLEKERYSEKYQVLLEQQEGIKKNNSSLSISIKLLEKENYQLALDKGKLDSQLLYLEEKLTFQKQELNKIGSQFQQEFELLANKILEEKAKKFTSQNQVNIENILHPLGRELEAFKKQVQEAYAMESRERFSLEGKVKELALLNQQISQEAKNLTNALKGNAKIRGNWGEAILETILQNSGLEKDRHYSIQGFLKDENGHPLIGQDGKRMQPDVIIHYPDDKKVIIDSKISLIAYEKYSSTIDEREQKLALDLHIKAIKTHIDQLSAKQYESYAKALDFVIMFIPLEAAYIVALQADPQIWEYAYKKRVLLISSSNLIAALKMIKDLWIRDDQSKNALEIAERGGKLYDKLSNFVNSLEDVGKHLDRSQDSYANAIKQLKTGKGNLLSQAEKLRTLGVNARNKISGEQ